MQDGAARQAAAYAMAKQMSLGFWNTLIVKILRISRVGFVSESRGRFNRSAIRLFKDNVLGAENPVVNLGLDYHVDIFVDYRVVWVYVRIPSARNVRPILERLFTVKS